MIAWPRFPSCTPFHTRCLFLLFVVVVVTGTTFDCWTVGPAGIGGYDEVGMELGSDWNGVRIGRFSTRIGSGMSTGAIFDCWTVGEAGIGWYEEVGMGLGSDWIGKCIGVQIGGVRTGRGFDC